MGSRRPAEPFWNESTERWVVFVELPSNGKKRRRKKVTGLTKAETRSKALKVQREVDDTGTTTNEAMTVEQLLEEYLAATAHTVRSATITSYRSWSDHHIIPFLGRAKVAKLLPRDVREWHLELVDNGRSVGTVKAAHRVLRQALSHGEREGHVTRNVAKIQGGPRGGEVKRVEPLTVDQVKALLAAVEDDYPLEGLTWLLLGTGLRISEALGLRWCDVDLEAATLEVTGQLVAVPGGSRERVDTPKTESGRRTVALSPGTVERLHKHRRLVLEHRMLLGAGAIPDDSPLFTTAAGTWVDRANISRSLKAAGTRAGIEKVHPHRLRHTHASMLLTAGVPLEAITDQLGHRKSQTTKDVYAHLQDRGRRNLAAAFDLALDSE